MFDPRRARRAALPARRAGPSLGRVSNAEIHPEATPALKPQPATLYLDLIERCLTNTIYGDGYTGVGLPGVERPFDPSLREFGRDWPKRAHTMIGRARLRNLRDLVATAISEGVPGDLIETGVWRGGACILMRAALEVLGDLGRRVFVADSFEGLPAPDARAYPADLGDKHHTIEELSISLDEVKANFAKYGLLDNRVIFLKGWFKDTLRAAPIERLAVLRLDGDMYESTTDALTALYDKVSPAGSSSSTTTAASRLAAEPSTISATREGSSIQSSISTAGASIGARASKRRSRGSRLCSESRGPPVLVGRRSPVQPKDLPQTVSRFGAGAGSGTGRHGDHCRRRREPDRPFRARSRGRPRPRPLSSQRLEPRPLSEHQRSNRGDQRQVHSYPARRRLGRERLLPQDARGDRSLSRRRWRRVLPVRDILRALGREVVACAVSRGDRTHGPEFSVPARDGMSVKPARRRFRPQGVRTGRVVPHRPADDGGLGMVRAQRAAIDWLHLPERLATWRVDHRINSPGSSSSRSRRTSISAGRSRSSPERCRRASRPPSCPRRAS